MFRRKASISLGCDSWRQIANGIREGVSKMSRNIRRGSQFPRVSLRVSLSCRWNFEHVKKLRAGVSRGCLARVSRAGVSNPSRTLLNLVSVSQKVRRNVRQLCKGLATYATKLWLIGDKNENLTFRARDRRELPWDPWERDKIARMSHELPAKFRQKFAGSLHKCRANVARHSRDSRKCQKIAILLRESRATVARVSRECRPSVARHVCELPANFGLNFAGSSCDIRATFVRHTRTWKISLIRVFSRNFVSPTSRELSQPSEILPLQSYAVTMGPCLGMIFLSGSYWLG